MGVVDIWSSVESRRDCGLIRLWDKRAYPRNSFTSADSDFTEPDLGNHVGNMRYQVQWRSCEPQLPGVSGKVAP